MSNQQEQQPPTIFLKIDVTKIEKDRIFNAKSGARYVDCVMIPKKSQYGDDYMIVQSVSKEERQQGIRGPIIGNGKFADKQEQPKQRRVEPNEFVPTPPGQRPIPVEEDEVPF